MNPSGKDHPRIVAYPPLIFLVCLGLGLSLYWLYPLQFSPRTIPRILGVIFLVAAAVLSAWASVTLRKAGTAVRPDRPSTTVVTTGPFRFTRNPLYLSLCLLHAGIALALATPIPLLLTPVLATILGLGVIVPEERYLEAKFGAAYSDYRSRVRRWL